MTGLFVEGLDDETLLKHFADCYGQTVFCPDNEDLKHNVEILRTEILRRMKNKK